MLGSPQDGRDRKGRRVPLVVVAAGTWVLLVCLIFLVLPGAQPRVRWEAGGTAPTPADFRYLMFPVNTSVPLHTVPDGPIVGTLARAVANTHSEVTSGGTGGWVEVQGPPSTTWVRLDQLGYGPPPGARVDYVEAHERAYIARAPEDYRSARLTERPADGGGRDVVFHLGQEDGWEEYEYTVQGGRTIAKRHLMMNGAAAGFQGFAMMLGAVLGASVLMPILLAAAWCLRRLRQGSGVAPTLTGAAAEGRS